MTRVAIVTVRYGDAVTGGAESHARQIARRLADRGHGVTVLTTCADDYATWANVRVPGESADGPVRVVRFPVRSKRTVALFDTAILAIPDGPVRRAAERGSLDGQGPDCPELLDHLREHGGDYDVVVFFTLLHAPIVDGLAIAGRRSILVPTLHDEPAVRTRLHADALAHAAYVLWNTPEERDLAARLYGPALPPGALGGVGVEAPPDVQVHAAAARRRLGGPYLAYAGRIDAEKGCGRLLRYCMALARDDPRVLLALSGRAWMPLPVGPHVRHLGFLSDAERWGLLAGATAVVVPSRRESLSLLAIEALAVGTPLLVDAASPVLAGHVRRSSGGLMFADAAEFMEAARRLGDDANLRDAMGRNGRRYAAANYDWEQVMTAYEAAVVRVTTGSSSASG